MAQFQEFLANEFSQQKVTNMFSIIVSTLYLYQKKALEGKIVFPELNDKALPSFLVELCIIALCRIDKLNQEKKDSIENLGMIDLDDTRHQWEEFLVILKLVLKIASSELLENFNLVSNNRLWTLLAQAGTLISTIKAALFANDIQEIDYRLAEDELFIEFLPLKSKTLKTLSAVIQNPGEADLVQIRCHQIISQMEALAAQV